MNKRLLLCGLFCLGMMSTSLVIAAPTTQPDPCENLTGGWDGNFWDLKNNKGCRVFYSLYKSYENISFKVFMIGECHVNPPEFNAICKEGKITANTSVNGQMTGIVYDRMLEMRNENYFMRLYK